MTKRAKCSKCGSKRSIKHLKSNCPSFNWEWKVNWCNYPRKDSYKCIGDCVPYNATWDSVKKEFN